MRITSNRTILRARGNFLATERVISKLERISTQEKVHKNTINSSTLINLESPGSLSKRDMRRRRWESSNLSGRTHSKTYPKWTIKRKRTISTLFLEKTLVSVGKLRTKRERSMTYNTQWKYRNKLFKKTNRNGAISTKKYSRKTKCSTHKRGLSK